MYDTQLLTTSPNNASRIFIRARRGLILSSLIWLIVLGSALLALRFKTQNIHSLIPLVSIGSMPAIITFILIPFLRRDWAQIAIIFAWIALAITACLSLGFFPSALLFVCAPAAASLFAREKVVESMALAGLSALGIYYMLQQGYGPDDILSPLQKIWAEYTLVIGFVIFILSTLFASSHGAYNILASKGAISLNEPVNKDISDKDIMAQDADELSQATFTTDVDSVDVDIANTSEADATLVESELHQYVEVEDDIIEKVDKGENNGAESLYLNSPMTKPMPLLAPVQSIQAEDNINWFAHYPLAALKLNQEEQVIDATKAAKKLFALSDADMGQVVLDKIGVAKEDTLLALRQSFQKAISDQSPQQILTQSILPHMQNETQLTLDFVPSVNNTVYVFINPHSNQDEEFEVLKRSYDFAQKEAKNKTLFFAGVSHELRTPLNAIIGFSDMMRSRLFGPLPSKYAEYADLIHESGQHMLDLIGDVLDLSKINIGKYELVLDEFDSVDVIRSSIKMLQPAADAGSVQINTQITSIEPLILQADRKALRQILLNLLSNAIKFSPKGGHVIVSASLVGENLVINIKDNGLGMSKQELEKVGEPFTQARSSYMVDTRGSGLGLSLVKSLTEMHQGKFTIVSKKDFGTTVTLTLPQTQNLKTSPEPKLDIKDADTKPNYGSELLLDTPLDS